MRAAAGAEEFGEMAELGSTYVGGGVGGGSSSSSAGGGGRWGSSYGGPTWGRTPQHRTTAGYHEAEDVTTTLQRRSAGMYYSPPGTSYTIVERPSSGAAHHHYTTQRTGTPRATYLGTNQASAAAVSVSNNKKRPISPEQIIRMFGNNPHHHNSTTKLSAGTERGGGAGSAGTGAGTHGHGTARRSPASSPASTTHQVSYSTRSPAGGYPLHELSTRTVTMVRDAADGTHGFGICVKGGKDSGVGVYISRVEEGSVAERVGLRPGDTILEVNGTPFTGISHEEALKMLKSCRKLSMTVRSPTLPGGGTVGSLYGSAGGPWLVRQTCSWMDRQGRPVSPPLEYARTSCVMQTPAPPPPPPPPPPPHTTSTRYTQHQHSRSTSKERSVRRVDLCIEPGQSLGLMIRGGVEYNLGIFITGVDKESVADRAGLMVGDQILEVNGQSFLDVTHDEAVSQLKYHKRMSLVVRDVGKVPHSCTAYGEHQLPLVPWDSPTAGARLSAASSARRWAAALQMVEEKARCLLARSEFASLCYYTDEYAARHMDVESYVHVVLELLNTSDKYTLLTELREIIAVEDRSRFDELVYNRPTQSSSPTTQASGPGRSGVVTDPREHDYRHARRKGGALHQLDGNHSMLMSSLHEISGTDYAVDEDEYRSPSEDSGLGLAVADRAASSQRGRPASSASMRGGVGGGVGHTDLPISNNEDHLSTQDYGQYIGSTEAGDLDVGLGGGRRHSSPGESRTGSDTQLHVTACDDYSHSTGYLGGLRSQLGGWTQRMKSWYWGRPLELAHKLSRSFDMKDEQGLLDGSGSELGAGGGMRRHQSMQRLARTGGGASDLGGSAGTACPGSERGDGPNVCLDMQGNLRVSVRKSKPILGIAIEGGANTKHPLPRIINIHENGAAYVAGGLEVGQLILQVDGQRVEGLQHQEVARLIAESFARPDREDIEFLVVEPKKSNLEPKPTALIFLEA